MAKTKCPQPANCDFEDPDFNFCTWTNVDNTIDNFDWKVHSTSDSFEFGLVLDNTLQDYNGHFMLSSGKKYQHYSSIYSELLPPTSDVGVCLTFYYYFKGKSGYNLTLRLEEYNKTTVYLWSLVDNQAPGTVVSQWKLGRVFLKTQDSYRIYMDGYVGNSDKDFIGVDDITFKPSNGFCTLNPTQAAPQDLTTTTTRTTTTTTLPTILELDCDFEGPCAWSNGPSNKATNWTVIRGLNMNEQYSINTDHTSGSPLGSYLTLETRSYFNKSTVDFISPAMNKTKCVEFWYYMFGPEVGTLSMYRKTSTSTVSSKIWSSKSSFSSQWQLAQASINYILPETKYTARIEFDFTESDFNVTFKFFIVKNRPKKNV